MKTLSDLPTGVLLTLQEILNSMAPPPFVSKIEDLSTEEGRLRLAEKKGAHDVAVKVAAAIRQQEQDRQRSAA